MFTEETNREIEHLKQKLTKTYGGGSLSWHSEKTPVILVGIDRATGEEVVKHWWYLRFEAPLFQPIYPNPEDNYGEFSTYQHVWQFGN